LFCRILQGREPACFVYRDDEVSAFMDIQPINPGHVLIVPNRHAAGLAELNPVIGGQIFQSGQWIAAVLRKSSLRFESVNFFLADGRAAHQEIFHMHLHVFPRYQGDGFKIKVGEQFDNKPERSLLETQALTLCRELEVPAE